MTPFFTGILDNFCFYLYRYIAYPTALFLLKSTRPFLPKKLKELIEDRKEKAWMSLPTKPVWIHASSGEIEYARDLIRKLKHEYPQIPILVTYFSPSAKRIIQNITEIDFSTPLPWDRKKTVTEFLNFFQPRMALFAKGDLWPELAEQIAECNIPCSVFSCAFSDSHADRNFFALALFRRSLNKISHVFCIADSDQQNLTRLGVKTTLSVAGDSRYDQVLFRVNNPRPLRFAFDKSEYKVMVCGSTWAEDDEILVEAFSKLLAQNSSRIIWAPHEIHEHKLQQLEKSFAQKGWSHQRYSKSESFNKQILLVDEIGSLQELYMWGHCAFVGGSFKQRVHSVMEALAAGCPVIVGPYHENNTEALHFQHKRLEGDIFVVQAVNNSREMSYWLEQECVWKSNEKMQNLLMDKAGASKRIMHWLDAQLKH